AYALGSGGGAAQGLGGGMGPLIPLILMFGIFWFLLIWPQQKKAKEQREMIRNLRKGDRIITSGGIFGRITGLDDSTVTLEIAEKVRIKVSRGNVNALSQPAQQSQASDSGQNAKGSKK
ncbi:preprotein translocase subunit YajC, partial [Thermodesulfobacteriota bacterium]